MRESIRAAGLARWAASHENRQPLASKANSKSSRLLNSVKHPLMAMKNAKRMRSPDQSPKPTKRQRAGDHHVIELNDDGEIVPVQSMGAIRQIGGRAVPTAADEPDALMQRDTRSAGVTDVQPSLPSTGEVLKAFRLDHRRLGCVFTGYDENIGHANTCSGITTNTRSFGFLSMSPSE